MQTFIITGRVYPPSVTVNTPEFRVTWIETTNAPPVRFAIQVIESLVHIECTVENFDPTADLSLYTTRGLELTRAVVDPIAFCEGVGLAVYLEEIVTPDGSIMSILYKNSKLKSLCKAFQEDFLKVQEMILAEPRIYMALNELIVAITFPGQIPINCARATEALRRIMFPGPDPNRKLGWAFMQQELNMERSYREYVTASSTEHRHGSRDSMDKEIVQEVLTRSWTIFNRFIEYRKRGNQRLPVSEFDLLK